MINLDDEYCFGDALDDFSFATSRIVYVKRNQLCKWDARFLELAEVVSKWSKGPRKRVGAIVARDDRSVVSVGYNGPPCGFDDDVFFSMSREQQHGIVIHAEDNALLRMPYFEFGRTCNLFVYPLPPCVDCAKHLIKDGRIKRVVAYCGPMSSDWKESAEEAKNIFKKFGVSCVFVTD